MSAKLPAIPGLSHLEKPHQRVLEPMKHIIESRLLPGGDLNRCPTLQELVNLGLITLEEARKV